jgi:hypothetical protein
MGYRRSRKVYKLAFEEFPGLEITTTSASVGELMEILELAGAMATKPDPDQMDMLFGAFAGHIREWNYEDEDGNPLKPTLETLKGEDSDFVTKLIAGWAQAISRADVPLAPASSGTSRNPVEESIPMAAASSPAGT